MSLLNMAHRHDRGLAASAGTLKFSGGVENLRTHRKPNHNHERLQQGEKATKDREVGQPERCNDEEQ